MDGYHFMIERNHLLYKLEEQLNALRNLPDQERRARTAAAQLSFDRELAALYAQVAEEFPGERRRQGRALNDPR
jgi:hypothetical protein